MKQVIRVGNTEIQTADYAIGATAILGIRDSGKTVTAKGIAHPEPVHRETITEVTGFKRSTRDRYLQYLQTRFLVVSESGGFVRASDTLFG